MVDLPPGDLRSAWRAMSRALIYKAPGEVEHCPACRSARVFDLDVLQVRRAQSGRSVGFVSGCDDCGLVFSNPLPSTDDLNRFYSPGGAWRSSRQHEGHEDDEAHEEVPGSQRVRGRSWSKPFNPIRDQLRVTRPPAGATVLDFGCGSGKLLDALQDHGWATWGIDPADTTAFRRHRRLDAIPDEPAFDLIIANHVLEHTVDPLDLLRQFARACRTGGYVFISVPRFDTLPLHRDYGYVINGRAHVTAYTWPCLQGLLARAGWTAVASPPDRVAKGRGRTTASRLRVIARRTETPPPPAPSPAAAARAAIRSYHTDTPGRPFFERLGWLRLSARRANARRRRATAVRKSAKIGAAVS
jgi:SAM-dependent methyltransferase